MRRKHEVRVGFLLLLAVAVPSVAQRSVSVVPASPVKIRLDELVVSGTTTLGSAELNEITNSLAEKEYTDNLKEMSERLSNAFQERGYFHPEIKNFKVKALDPLGNPKPVRIEADVNEGLRYRFGVVKFEGMRAFTAERMVSEFPIHAGEYFDVEKIRSGLTALRNLYTRQGYLMMMAFPDTQEGSDATITLAFKIDEGQQFRMGSLEFRGDDEVASKLRSHWRLASGEPFDDDYARKFVEENNALLPRDFSFMNDVRVDLNCREGTADVRIDADPKHPAMAPAKLIGCDTPSEQEKEADKQK